METILSRHYDEVLDSSFTIQVDKIMGRFLLRIKNNILEGTSYYMVDNYKEVLDILDKLPLQNEKEGAN
jgi:hypothetical protein